MTLSLVRSAVAVTMLTGALFGGSAAVGDAPRTYIRDARVFDGTQVIGETGVLIEGGLIIAVGTPIVEPADAIIIDGSGHTLMPGLIDCHTHIAFEPMLEQALVFGVTTELDMFMSAALARELRAKDAQTLADFRTAGTLVTAPGGHGTQFGLPIRTIESPEEAETFVDRCLEEGSDYIKIVYDDGSAMGFELPTIDLATLTAVIEAAHARDRLAVVHIHDADRAVEAIEAGADGLAHLFVDRMPDDGFAELVRLRGAFVVPTLAVIQSVCGTAGGAGLTRDPRTAPYLGPMERSSLERPFPIDPDAPPRRMDVAMTTVLRLREAGVPILAGTDAPNPGTAHGASIHHELELLVQAGLTPTEALASATSVPARVFGLDDRGRIRDGLRADLLLVEGNPLEDITATRRIAGIWRAGVPVDREAYRARMESPEPEPIDAPADGVVSAFDGDAVRAETGFGWQVSTDRMRNGHSTAEIAIATGGADGTTGSLEISGVIKEGWRAPWAGAVYSPGEGPFAPIDLSAYEGLSFWAQGDGGTYRVMVFAKALGGIPKGVSFVAGPEWTRHVVRFTDFDETMDGRGFMAVMFTGGPATGAFTFRIDEFRLDAR